MSTPTAAVYLAALERIRDRTPEPGLAWAIAAAALRPIPDHRRRLSADAILDHALIEERTDRRAESDTLRGPVTVAAVATDLDPADCIDGVLCVDRSSGVPVVVRGVHRYEALRRLNPDAAAAALRNARDVTPEVHGHA